MHGNMGGVFYLQRFYPDRRALLDAAVFSYDGKRSGGETRSTGYLAELWTPGSLPPALSSLFSRSAFLVHIPPTFLTLH